MEIVGTIKKISPVQQITPTFSKRECVILTDEMYPQTIMVEFAQSRTGLLDGFSEGQYVRVSINLRGREWTDPRSGEVKYFTSVGGWRIEASAPGAAQGAAAPANPFAAQGSAAPSQGFAAPSQAAPSAGGEDDDLPF